MNKLEQEVKNIKVKAIISTLKEINIDGETMEHILKEVCMDEQMFKQLIGRFSDLYGREYVMNWLDEVCPVKNSAENRLLLVMDDITTMRRILPKLMYENNMEIEMNGDASMNTLLNNIEIACDLTDNESDGWGFTNKPVVKPVKDEKELLIDKVLDRLEKDINGNDQSGVCELLRGLSIDELKGYLCED